MLGRCDSLLHGENRKEGLFGGRELQSAKGKSLSVSSRRKLNLFLSDLPTRKKRSKDPYFSISDQNYEQGRAEKGMQKCPKGPLAGLGLHHVFLQSPENSMKSPEENTEECHSSCGALHRDGEK